MLRLKTNVFDMVISLGGNCSAALQLKHRGRRRYSLPLDWALMTDVTPVKKLPELLKSHFDGFLEWKNVIEYEPAIMERGTLTHHIQDTFSGIKLIHHFRGKKFDRNLFDPGKSVMSRRIERMYKMVSRSRRVLFVLETAFQYDNELANAIFTALTDTFPMQEVHFVVMQFEANDNSESWSCNDRMVICRYQRDFNTVYDNQFTTPEWCWMDSLKITGMELPEHLRKRNLLIKWAYKIWWTLGKWLERKGAGVTNMRFRDFGAYTYEGKKRARGTMA